MRATRERTRRARFWSPDLAAVSGERHAHEWLPSGTGAPRDGGLDITVAGKTGTAQVDEGEPHSWFAGFAPYDGDPREQIAFAVVVEHGGYGAQVAAPVARKIVEAARDLGIIRDSTLNPHLSAQPFGASHGKNGD